MIAFDGQNTNVLKLFIASYLCHSNLFPEPAVKISIGLLKINSFHTFDPRYLEIAPAVCQGPSIQIPSSLICAYFCWINPEGSSDFVSLRRKRRNYSIHCNCFVYSIVAWSKVHWSQRESFQKLQWAQVHNALFCRTSEVSLEGLKTAVAFSTFEMRFKSTQTRLQLHTRKGVKLNV